MILAVDTSLGTAVALVGADGAVHAEASVVGALGHAEHIGELLTGVLADAGSPTITHVAAGMGPGPFTGLRIGIAAARAFALGRGAAFVPVPSHVAAALTHMRDGEFAVVTDARRREMAVSVFHSLDSEGLPRQTGDTALVARADLAERLGETPAAEVAEIVASDLGKVAARALAAGRVLTGPEPLYLRQPDVSLPGAPKRVGA